VKRETRRRKEALMAGIATLAATVGAGASQVRFQDHAKLNQLTDQKVSGSDMRSAALRLIERALTPQKATGRDLDVVA
jgi:hypothetical protein